MRSLTAVLVLWVASLVGWWCADLGSGFETRCEVLFYALLAASYPAGEADACRRRLDRLETRQATDARLLARALRERDGADS